MSEIQKLFLLGFVVLLSQEVESRFGLFNGDILVKSSPLDHLRKKSYSPITINYSPVHEVKEFRGFGSRQIAGNIFSKPPSPFQIMNPLRKRSIIPFNFRPRYPFDLKPRFPFDLRQRLPFNRRFPTLRRHDSDLIEALSSDIKYLQFRNRIVNRVLRNPIQRRLVQNFILKNPNLARLLHKIPTDIRMARLRRALQSQIWETKRKLRNLRRKPNLLF